MLTDGPSAAAESIGRAEIANNPKVLRPSQPPTTGLTRHPFQSTAKTAIKPNNKAQLQQLSRLGISLPISQAP